MKKTISKKLALFIAISMGILGSPASLFSQSFNKGDKFISLGYGFPNLAVTWLNAVKSSSTAADWKPIGIGPIHLKFESAINESWGLGFSINYSNYGAHYTDNSTGTPYAETTLISGYSALLRINNYFVNEDKLQIYGGIGAGYRGRSVSVTTTNPAGSSANNDIKNLYGTVVFPVGFEATIGLRGFFSNNLGGYLEMGMAKSVIQAGLFVKLGKPVAAVK
jgi:opacity protein-like surface antigen